MPFRTAVRVSLVALVAAAAFATAAAAMPARQYQPARPFQSLNEVTDWINDYRRTHDAERMGEAVKAVSRLGGFKDPEQAGIYVGFIAGVIGANPGRADALIARMFPLSESDHWAVVRGIAYSGAPNWRFLLRRAEPRMPSRKVMIASYIDGRLPVLGDMTIKASPTTWQRLRASLAIDLGRKKKAKPELEPTQALLDTLWGYYLATASYAPLMRLVDMLPWSEDRDDAERLTLGSMTKYTLAANAARDAGLLETLRAIRRAKARKDADSVKPLDEVIAAAETAETGKLRRDALAAIETLKTKGPAYKRELSTWGKVGQGAIAVGCVAAAATGHVELGLPCVIGGGATSAAMYYLSDK